ncbi:MAG: hypothetical protein JO307_04830 [Bryobacterales bacterium]|nr:hypothetical protein [Bryobacterales bacterium]
MKPSLLHPSVKARSAAHRALRPAIESRWTVRNPDAFTSEFQEQGTLCALTLTVA